MFIPSLFLGFFPVYLLIFVCYAHIFPLHFSHNFVHELFNFQFRPGRQSAGSESLRESDRQTEGERQERESERKGERVLSERQNVCASASLCPPPFGRGVSDLSPGVISFFAFYKYAWKWIPRIIVVRDDWDLKARNQKI